MLHTFSDGKGGQKIEDTGPLTQERMPTVDQEIFAAEQKFVDAAAKDGKPFFVWFNTTHMHAWTHVKPESRGQSGRWVAIALASFVCGVALGAVMVWLTFH